MKTKCILLIVLSLFCLNLFSQYQAILGDFEFRTSKFGKMNEKTNGGEQSIKMNMDGRVEIVFMFDEETDMLCQGTDNNLQCYVIKDVLKRDNHYQIKTSYLQGSEAIYYFDISKECKEIVINFGDKEKLILLDSDTYSSEKYKTYVSVFEYLDKKY